MGYTSKALKGLSWSWGLTFSLRGVSFFRTIILARILNPSQFGIYGVGILLMALLETFTETGINVFLVQKKGEVDRYINSAWIVSILRGLIIFLSIAVLSKFVALFFNSPDSSTLILLFGVVGLIRGFINPSIVKFQKELDFHKEFFYRLAITLVEAVVSIMLAFYTHLAISLVLGVIAGAIVEVALSFVFVSPSPRFSYKKEQILEVFHKGKWLTIAGIFNYFFHNMDNIVVGKLLGVGSLGLYEMAYNISMLPITDVSDVVSKVTFPVYSLISTDRKRLQRAFAKSIVGISLITIPFGLIILLFPYQLVNLVLGEKWLGMVNVLRVLAIFGVIRAISGSTSALFLSVEKQKYVTVVTLVSILGLVITIVPLVNKFGLVGAGVSALLGSLFAVPFMFYFTVKTLK